MTEATSTDQADQINLSDTQKETLVLIAEGRSSREVADALCVSKRTVDWRLQEIYGRLRVKGRIQAIRSAERLGLIEVRP